MKNTRSQPIPSTELIQPGWCLSFPLPTLVPRPASRQTPRTHSRPALGPSSTLYRRLSQRCSAPSADPAPIAWCTSPADSAARRIMLLLQVSFRSGSLFSKLAHDHATSGYGHGPWGTDSISPHAQPHNSSSGQTKGGEGKRECTYGHGSGCRGR